MYTHGISIPRPPPRLIAFPHISTDLWLVGFEIKWVTIDPFNKSNIHSFPLLTTYSAFEILLKTFSFNDVNSGKLYILDLLKGSITVRFLVFAR